MTLSIVIPTMNRGEVFQQTLTHAINAVKHIHSEIIIVNDSKQKKIEPRYSSEVSLIYVDNPKSGVASARNLGASLAKSPLLLFLDDDILITKESIDATLLHHRHHDNVCINPDWVYPQVLQEKLSMNAFGRFMIRYNLVSFKGWYNHPRWRENDIFESPIVASFHLSISKRKFSEVGGYNESFPHAGFEDYDFPVRLKQTGVKFYIDTTIRVFHNEEDRVEIHNWLMRQYRGAQTRKRAVDLGYSELAINYSIIKKIILETMCVFKFILYKILSSTSLTKRLDAVSFKLILGLQAIHIYEGYSRK